MEDGKWKKAAKKIQPVDSGDPVIVTRADVLRAVACRIAREAAALTGGSRPTAPQVAKFLHSEGHPAVAGRSEETVVKLVQQALKGMTGRDALFADSPAHVDKRYE